MDILDTAETAHRLGARPEDINDLFDRLELSVRVCPMKAGSRLIPAGYLDIIRTTLSEHGRPVAKSIYQEEAIVWLEDIDPLDYVRVVWVSARTRKGRPPFAHCDGRLVGYATLWKKHYARGTSGSIDRRVFCLAPWDRDSEPDGTYRACCPCEAVDPRTVRPNIEGEKTERCRSGS